MNKPILLAQLSGSSTQGAPPKNLKLEKPQNGAAVTVHLDGNSKLDFSDVAGEKLTFVRVGDKLVVLFDNASTVTIDPVFGQDGHPRADLAFAMGADRTLTGDQFAELFPITTDQSVLPAAGGTGGPTAGAHFGDPHVDALSSGTALDLLGSETVGSTFNEINEGTPNPAPIAGVVDVAAINEDGLSGNPGGLGDVPGALSVSGSFHLNFGTDAAGRTLAFSADQPTLTALTSDGQAVHLFVTTVGGLPTMIGYVGTDPLIAANQVFTVSLDANSTAEGSYTVTLLRPLDHPIQGTEDTLNLVVNVIATDGSGDTVATAILVNVNDDTPVIVAGNETHSTLTDPLLFHPATQSGSLGISWGADRFNDNVDGGTSTGNGDRAVVFTDALVTATGSTGDAASTIAALTSFGATVHYSLLDNGTVLVAYTGNVVPSLPGSGGGSEGGDGPFVSPNLVFVVTLSDASDAGSYVITQYQPLDHNVGAQTFASIDLAFHFTATDSDGDPVSRTLTATVNDTLPVVTGAIGDQTVIESTLSGPPDFPPDDGPSFQQLLVAIDGNAFATATTGGILNIDWASDTNNIVNGVASHDRGVTFATTTAPDGLTSNGVQLVYTVTDNGTLLTATAGANGPTVFTVQLSDAGSGSYSFTLVDNLDHASGNGANNLPLTFAFTATDSDGDTTAPANFVVNVTDDTPTIGSPDTNTVIETTSATAANSFIAASATGSLAVDWNSDDHNVANGVASHDRGVAFATSILTGDAVHTDAAGSPVLTSKGVTVRFYVVSATEIYGLANDNGGSLSLTGSHADRQVFHIILSDSGDGSYTFTLLDNLDHPIDLAVAANTLGLTFRFTATDSDGDVATPASFTVTVKDDIPVAGVGTATTIDEGDLPGGNDNDSHGHGYHSHDPSVTGKLNIDWNSDDHDGGAAANRSVTFQHAIAAENVVVGGGVTTLTSGGHAVHYAFIDGDLVGYTGSDPRCNQVFSVSLNDDNTGSYTFTLLGNLDHPAGHSENTLTLTFDYTATDSDGDPSRNTFTVTVKDDVPVIGHADNETVYEQDLPTTSYDTSHPDASNSTVQTGDLDISWGADDNDSGASNNRAVAFTTTTAPSGLTSNGFAISYALSSDGTVLTATSSDNRTIFTISLNDDNDGSYRFTLYGNIDHAASGLNDPSRTLSFGFQATDSDGDTATSSFNVTIVDDNPVAYRGDSRTVDEDDLSNGTSPHASDLTVTGDLNISWGADSANPTAHGGLGDRSVAFSSATASHNVDAEDSHGHNLTLKSDGQAVNYAFDSNGALVGYTGASLASGTRIFEVSLSDQNDGSYTFKLLGNLDHPAGNGQNIIDLTFSYTATDGDGDTSSNSFTVTVKDDVPVIGSPTASTLTEDATGTAGAESFVTQTASNVSLAINWGADDSNSGSANRSLAFSSSIDSGDTVRTTGSGSPALTSNGVTVQFIRVSDTEIWGVANDNGGPLSLSDRKVFHITLSDADGSYTFMLLDNVDHLGSGQGSALALKLGFDATDADGDKASGNFVVTINDDNGPTIGSPESKTLLEATTGTAGSESFASSSQTGSLLVSWGADDNNSGSANRSVAFASSIHSGDIVHSAGSGSPALTSNGSTVYFYRVSSTEIYGLANDNGGSLDLTGPNADRQVFHITLSDSGAGGYSFTLLDNIDHVGTGQGSSIGLTFGFVATDADGDTAPSSFTVNVTDMAPSFAAAADSVGVDEDGLNGGNAGESYTTGDQSGAAITKSGHLHIAWGADDANPGLGSIDRDVVFDGIAQNSTATAVSGSTPQVLTAHGQAVQLWVSADGHTLYGYVGAAPTGSDAPALAQQVFTVTLSDSGDGSYSFTLQQSLDHPATNSEDDLKLSFGFKASDADSDPISSNFSVAVNDDAPTLSAITAHTVDEEHLVGGNDGDSYGGTTGSFAATPADDGFQNFSDSLYISWGADSANSGVNTGRGASQTLGDRAVVFAADAITTLQNLHLTSNGEALTYVISNSGTLLQAGVTTGSNPRIVFGVLLTDQDNGGYLFNLVGNLDHATAGAEDSLGLTFNFTAYDSDGDSRNGSFQVNVNDDAPTLAAITTHTVDEEHLVGGNDGDSYGGTTGSFAATPADNAFQNFSDSLNIFWGADSANSGVNAGRGASQVLGDRAVVFAADAISTLQNLHLTSNGEALSYVISNSGTLLQAAVTTGSNPRIVFGVLLTDQNNGGYLFNLVGNLDHATAGAEDDVGLTFKFTAYDSDGDSRDGSFQVNVNDDAPTLGAITTHTVDEEHLLGGNDGDSYGGTTGSFAATPSDNAAQSFTDSLNISWGADSANSGVNAGRGASQVLGDRAVVFASDAITTLQNLHLTSNGEALSYSISGNGTLLLAGVTTGPNPRVVFGVLLTDQNSGGYLFNLVGNLDHPTAGAEDSLPITFNFTAYDSDGDSRNGSFQVNVNDDAPTLGTSAVGTVSEDGPLALTAASLAVSWGADSANVAGADRALAFSNATVGVTDPAGGLVALTSYGADVHVGFIGGVLVGYTGAAPAATTDSNVVFFASLSDVTGSYNFTLRQPLDHAAPVGTSDYLDLKFNITATDSDHDSTTGTFTVRVDAAGSIGSIDYTSEITGVFVNLGGTDAVSGAQTVHGHTATDLVSGGGHVIGIDALGTIADASGGAAGDVLVGGSAANVLHGNGGDDTLIGGGDNDTITGDAGDDAIIYNTGDGSDTIDGGANTDRLNVNGDGNDNAFVVSNSDGDNSSLEVKVDGATSLVKNVEEIYFTGNGGNDTLAVSGNLNGTGLSQSTIHFDGGTGDDTLDLRGELSPHRVVFDGGDNNAGGDTVILGFAFNAAGTSYVPVLDSIGHLIGASITYQTANGPVTDTFTNVEHFQFTDGTRSAGQIFPPSFTGGATSGTITEADLVTGDSTPDTTQGTVTFADVDATNTHTASASYVAGSAAWSGGAAGGIPAQTLADLANALGAQMNFESSQAANGQIIWTATLPDQDLDFLGLNETLTASFDLTVTGATGGSTTEQVTVTFKGADDKPVITAAVASGTIVEDTPENVYNGNFDNGLAGWTGTPDRVVAEFGYALFMSNVFHDTASLTQSIQTVAGASYTLSFWTDSVFFSGQVLEVDWGGVDVGTLALPSDPRFQFHTIDNLIGDGNQKALSFVYKPAYGVYMTLDFVSLVGPPSPTASTNGTIAFSDADASDTHQATFAAQNAAKHDDGSAYLGTFSLDPVSDIGGGGSVTWHFTVNQADIQFLAEGQVYKQSYDVTINDLHGGTTVQTVEVDITGVNDKPVATAHTVSAGEDDALTVTSASLLAGATDVDGDTLTVTTVSNATNGTVVLGGNGNAVFTPGANFSGVAGFDYTVDDAHGGTVTAHVTVDIAPKVDAVVFSAGSLVEGSGNFGGAPVGIADEVLVNTSTYYYQANPSIAVLKDGGYVITWQTYVYDYTINNYIYGVSGQRYDADGHKVDGEFKADVTTGNQDQVPSVTGLSDGGFVVTWQQSGYDASSNTSFYKILGQRYDASGAAHGSQFLIDTATADYQYAPATTALANGGFVTAWIHNNAVVGQFFDASGKVGGEVQLNTSGAYPALTTLSDGSFVLACYAGNQSTLSSDIQVQHFSATGQQIGNTTWLDAGGATDYGAALAATADGGFVVSWTINGGAIAAQRFDATGGVVGGVIPVNAIGGALHDSSVTGLLDGGFLVTWTNSSDGEVHGQRFDGSGHTLGMEVGSSRVDLQACKLEYSIVSPK